MDTKLAQHFTYTKLLKFVFPSIVMMIFTSIYSVVDGLFVSNFVGKTAFASINLIMPFIMGLTAWWTNPFHFRNVFGSSCQHSFGR